MILKELALEKEISDLHNKDAALVFTSGYIANQATLSTISKINNINLKLKKHS